MKKMLILAFAILPFLIVGCRKNKKPSPLPAVTYIEKSPQQGRSSITFNHDFTLTVQDLRITPPARFEYKYRLEDGKMIVTPPPIDSYVPNNPVSYELSTSGELRIDPFRPPLWTEKVAYYIFTKQ